MYTYKPCQKYVYMCVWTISHLTPFILQPLALHNMLILHALGAL